MFHEGHTICLQTFTYFQTFDLHHEDMLYFEEEKAFSSCNYSGMLFEQC